MAADQRNYQNFLYVDDHATHWTKRGELNTAINAIDGSAPQDGSPMFPKASRRYHTRYAVFVDPTTQRTKKIVVYTAAAFAALTSASTLALHVEGETATVTYNLSETIPEKLPVPKTISSQRIDHP